MMIFNQTEIATMCPDGTYMDGSNSSLVPDGSYVSDRQCVIVPDGSYIGDNSSTICPGSSYSYGTYQIKPDGSYD